MLTKKNRLSLYKGSDHIGKRGVEQNYEHLIHGVPGFKKIEVDAKGNIVRTIKRKKPINGQNIHLSIDIELQKKAIDAFGNKKGALVAISPLNGEILAYVSKPQFNPNLFVNGIDYKNWNLLNKNKENPLLDRVTKGLYPPGSTIKPFIAIAGLENNLRVPPFQIIDPGFFTMPNQSKTFRNWKRDGHGSVDMVKAIAVSSDTFFYGLGLELGIDKINQTLQAYGFGQKTGIDLLGEKKGLLANQEWKLKNKKEKWYAGETVITAIGQGFTQVTPLQLANATAKIALPNNKNYVSPHLLLNSNQLKHKNDSLYTPPPLKKNTMQFVKRGMEALTEKGGTAAFLNNINYKIAAKTGTAQVFGLAGGEYIEDDLPDHLKDHALFIAYAPAEKPELVLAIIVENGGSGGSTAGPIAKKVFDYFLLDSQ
jgi:penicillin-binding protein 2